VSVLRGRGVGGTAVSVAKIGAGVSVLTGTVTTVVGKVRGVLSVSSSKHPIKNVANNKPMRIRWWRDIN
jgi:hypothetical protein